MKNIKNIDNITKVHKDWRPCELAFIKSIELEYNKLLIKFLGQIRKNKFKWPDYSNNFYEVIFLFEGLSNFKLDITPSEYNMYQISGFDIRDISQNKFENLNFQIEDYENDTISFYCNTISVMSELNFINIKEIL